MKEDFDLSKVNYANPYYQADFGAKNAVRWKRTDEASSNAISDFVRLREKMYSFEMLCRKADATMIVQHRAT